MNDPRRVRESEILDQLTARYRAQGYAVEHDALLPGTAARADLVARRADETVLVELTPRTDRGTGIRRSLAEYAASRGWRFSIVVADGQEAFDEVDVLSRDEVLRLLSDAGALAPTSWIAAVAAVAAFEAAARFALARADRRSMPRRSPVAHVQALSSSGLITPDEESVLRRLIDARNAAAHGLAQRALPADTIPATLRIARSLLDDEAVTAA